MANAYDPADLDDDDEQYSEEYYRPTTQWIDTTPTTGVLLEVGDNCADWDDDDL